ncbi:PepSY-associated TM helix domain-containing protein [Pokkaliibacter sp. CJK22405]|uniref:PepSY-associated TM helix domain-containing protein n=1 Tax=Pokkaliibacter sp. CJK22405 TaxID=3384615 RepID=UPI003984D8E8
MTKSARKPLFTGAAFRLIKDFHWVSSAAALGLLVLFSLTGITLNHPSWFAPANPEPVHQQPLPKALQNQWLKAYDADVLSNEIPGMRAWLSEQGIELSRSRIEVLDDEVSFERRFPGGFQRVTLMLSAGELDIEHQQRGLIAIINDLHKGRDTGELWRWVIDLSAVLMLVFAVSGLLLLLQFAHQRPATWPLVLSGIALPFLLCVWVLW